MSYLNKRPLTNLLRLSVVTFALGRTVYHNTLQTTDGRNYTQDLA